MIRLSEPVAVTDSYEIFGAEVAEWDETLSLAEVISATEKLGKKADVESLSFDPVTIEAEVAEVCQKKGCFFIATDGENTARVTFKDYGFFVPTDSQGKKVKLVGTFSIKELSEDQARHYAEDAGKNPDEISGPQKEYSIVATSVLVPLK